MYKQSKLLLFTILLSVTRVLYGQMNLEFQDTLQQTLQNFATSKQMMGVSGSVVFPDGSVWSGATGQYATENQSGQFSVEPLHTDLLFDIGSNTKSMTSTLILLLEEENALSIEDTLYTYIDPVPNVPYGITLKQLMEHMSGLSSYTDHPDFGNTVNDANSGFLHPDTVLSLYLEAPVYAPGTIWHYSNTNYLLLGKVIESIENLPYHEVLQERIFTPYSLNNMFLDQYQTYTPLSKVGTWFGSANFDPTDYIAFMSAAWTAGGVVSKPEDLASYCHQLCRGDILSVASMNKMTTGTTMSLGEYGLGLIKSTYNGRAYLNHGGTTLQNSEMHYSIETDFSVAVINIDYGFNTKTNQLQKKMIDLLESLIPEYLSVNELVTAEILTAFPNPSDNQIYIRFPDQSNHLEKHIEVYNTSGKLCLSFKTKGEQIVLDKAQFGSGMFLVKAFDSQNVIGVRKIIFN